MSEVDAVATEHLHKLDPWSIIALSSRTALRTLPWLRVEAAPEVVHPAAQAALGLISAAIKLVVSGELHDDARAQVQAAAVALLNHGPDALAITAQCALSALAALRSAERSTFVNAGRFVVQRSLAARANAGPTLPFEVSHGFHNAILVEFLADIDSLSGYAANLSRRVPLDFFQERLWRAEMPEGWIERVELWDARVRSLGLTGVADTYKALITGTIAESSLDAFLQNWKWESFDPVLIGGSLEPEQAPGSIGPASSEVAFGQPADHISGAAVVSAIATATGSGSVIPSPGEPASPSPKSEFNLRLEREAPPEEAAIQIDRYALVLRKLMDGAGGEFCLALFGHWGRGKTYLMRRIARGLAKGSWWQRRTTIFFSAWKYPTTPEVWVHLYETLADASATCWLPKRIARDFRAGMHRSGISPLIWIMLALSAAITPFYLRWESAKTWLPIVGLFGAVFLVKLYFGLRRTGRHVLRQYCFRPRHSDKLGLQAVVGADMVAMLKAWVLLPRWRDLFNWPTIRKWIWGLLLYATAVKLVAYAFTPHSGRDLWVDLPLLGKIPEYLNPVIVTTLREWWVLAAAVLLPTWLGLFGFERRKLLLVVDDLDRCDPTQMVTVVESLKILLENPAVADRMQVVMLLEEDAFRVALERRYQLLLGRNEPGATGSSGPYSPDRLWRESVEKLFVVHLKMPVLQPDDALGLLDRLFEADRRRGSAPPEQRDAIHQRRQTAVIAQVKDALEQQRVLRAESPVPSDHEDDLRRDEEDLTELEFVIREASGAAPTDGDVTREGSKAPGISTSRTLDEADEVALAAVVPLMCRPSDGLVCGPRTIRNFVFRYQLAKLLLESWNQPVVPRLLAARLAAAAGFRVPAAVHNAMRDEHVDELFLAKVVGQVS